MNASGLAYLDYLLRDAADAISLASAGGIDARDDNARCLLAIIERQQRALDAVYRMLASEVARAEAATAAASIAAASGTAEPDVPPFLARRAMAEGWSA